MNKTHSQINAVKIIVDEHEFIPHPDTTRLNWLEKQMLNDSGKEIVHDGYGFTTLENLEDRKCAQISETLREAIDYEIKKQCLPSSN